MHTLLKREKSWANTPIHGLTCDATSCLFADIFFFAMEALEQKREEKMVEEMEEDE